MEKMEWLYIMALKYLRSLSIQEASSVWPWLHTKLNSKENGSLAFLVDYGDIRHSDQTLFKVPTAKNATKRPLQVVAFSNAMSADPSASVRMALPTYFSVNLARSRSRAQLLDSDNSIGNRIAWKNKYSQAIWRGTCNSGESRWNLNKLAFETGSQLLNVRFTDIAQGQIGKRNFSQVGTLVNPIPMEQFAKYKAILDVDGNSWSGRFGSLLCMDSVVVKIEPEMVDHFWSELQPWQHYVPVHANLSNLIEQVEWVIGHAKISQKIIQNSNAWCQRKFNTESLVRDLLNIWESYATNILIPSSSQAQNARDAVYEKLSWVQVE
jgi:hypothetical protein